MRRDRRTAARGFALIEAIVAIAIVGTAIVATIAMVSQSLHAIETARAADKRTAAASRALERAAVFSRAELEARLGTTEHAGWTLSIDRPASTLFVLAVADTSRGTVLLRTAVYRPEAPGASP